MHSATLDTAAAILLLSSIGSMGLLVKRTPKSRIASPTSVLSMSDILSSILTSLMVLLHHFYVNNEQSWSSKVKKVTDSKYVHDFPRNGRSHFGLNSTEFSEGDTQADCDLQGVLFQYALFFIPFINAFLSLLNFSFNCYTSARDIDKRCCRLICAQSDAEKNVAAAEDEIESDPTEKKEVHPRSRSSRRRRLTGAKIFRRKYKGLALLGQWLLPALFTGSFHLGERRALDVPGEDPVCVVAANFPFESCAEEPELGQATSSAVHSYVSSEDSLLRPHPNTSEVDDVIKRILGVVQAAMNESASPAEGYSSVTQLLDVANGTSYDGSEFQLGSNLIQRRYDGAEGSGASDDYSLPYFSSGASLSDDEQVTASSLHAAECVKRRCVVSVRFLKIYLFVLLVLMYFAPILLSNLLLVVSHYKCREAARKLKGTKAVEDKAVQNSEDTEESNKEGWFPAKTDQEAAAAEQAEDGVPSKNRSKVEETVCALACEADKVQGFFRIFKVNAACAVALWTPFFLQIISKVFFCSRVPNWVTEVSFLATMAFAVFRNAVNLSIVKMEADAENFTKSNSVHPNR